MSSPFFRDRIFKKLGIDGPDPSPVRFCLEIKSNSRFSMNTIVPLISSGVAGPLGVIHLPRLWLKLSLECRGNLAAAYPGCGTGFDQMVIDGLGLKRDAVIDFIKTNCPTYPQFEAWIKSQPDVKL